MSSSSSSWGRRVGRWMKKFGRRTHHPSHNNNDDDDEEPPKSGIFKQLLRRTFQRSSRLAGGAVCPSDSYGESSRRPQEEDEPVSPPPPPPPPPPLRVSPLVPPLVPPLVSLPTVPPDEVVPEEENEIEVEGGEVVSSQTNETPVGECGTHEGLWSRGPVTERMHGVLEYGSVGQDLEPPLEEDETLQEEVPVVLRDYQGPPLLVLVVCDTDDTTVGVGESHDGVEGVRCITTTELCPLKTVRRWLSGPQFHWLHPPFWFLAEDGSRIPREYEDAFTIGDFDPARTQEDTKKWVLELERSHVRERSERVDTHLVEVSEETALEGVELENVVGEGSYGIVYRGEWHSRTVAVKRMKEMPPKQLSAFFQEVQLLRQLRHENVVTFLGARLRPPNRMIVTELIPRGTLHRILHGGDEIHTFRLELPLLVRLGLDIATAMQYLHSRQPMILHRDLKPENVLVDADWTAKLSDFGLAIPIAGGSETARGLRFAGTPEYAAPEVMAGGPPSDRSDVFSFGMLLWEMQTGELPFADLDTMEVASLLLENPGVRPRLSRMETHPVLFDLVTSCWDTNPRRRPMFRTIVQRLEELALELATTQPTQREERLEHALHDIFVEELQGFATHSVHANEEFLWRRVSHSLRLRGLTQLRHLIKARALGLSPVYLGDITSRGDVSGAAINTLMREEIAIALLSLRRQGRTM